MLPNEQARETIPRMTVLVVGATGSIGRLVVDEAMLLATGSLLVSTAARIGRIEDRIRAILVMAENPPVDFPEPRRKHAEEQLRHLQQRSNRAMAAIAMLYLAFGAFVATCMAIAVTSLADHYAPALPVALAVAGVGFLLAACVNLVVEACCVLRGNDREVRFFFELETMRKPAERNRSAVLSGQELCHSATLSLLRAGKPRRRRILGNNTMNKEQTRCNRTNKHLP